MNREGVKGVGGAVVYFENTLPKRTTRSHIAVEAKLIASLTPALLGFRRCSTQSKLDMTTQYPIYTCKASRPDHQTCNQTLHWATLIFSWRTENIRKYDSLFLTTSCINSLFQYIYYIPLHVSSTTVLIFRRTIVLTCIWYRQSL